MACPPPPPVAVTVVLSLRQAAFGATSEPVRLIPLTYLRSATPRTATGLWTAAMLTMSQVSILLAGATILPKKDTPLLRHPQNPHPKPTSHPKLSHLGFAKGRLGRATGSSATRGCLLGIHGVQTSPGAGRGEGQPPPGVGFGRTVLIAFVPARRRLALAVRASQHDPFWVPTATLRPQGRQLTDGRWLHQQPARQVAAQRHQRHRPTRTVATAAPVAVAGGWVGAAWPP